MSPAASSPSSHGTDGVSRQKPGARVGAALLLALSVALSIALGAGCAIFEPENRRTLNALDRTVKIESTAGKVAAAPLAVPIGCAAWTADLLLVHPISAIPRAYGDTVDAVWEEWSAQSELRDAMLFLPKVTVTPLYFTGDWAFRCLFPIPYD